MKIKLYTLKNNISGLPLNNEYHLDKIEDLEKLLEDNPSLECLDFLGYEFKSNKKDKEFFVLESIFKKNKTIEVLDLSSTGIERMSDRQGGVRNITSILSVNQSLREINLSDNFIDNEGFEAILFSVAIHDNVQFINFKNNKDISAKIQKSKVYLKVTALLDLSGTAVSEKEIENLNLQIKENRQKPRDSLSRVILSNSSGMEFVYENIKIDDLPGLINEHQAVELNLSRQKLNFFRCELLYKALMNVDSLSKINIRDNPIGYKGYPYLLNIFEKNKDLFSLDLSHTDLNDDSCSLLSHILVDMKELILSNNPLVTNEKWGILFQSIANSNNPKLIKFVLNDNDIGDKAYLFLEKVIKNSSDLTFLSLAGNRITANGCKFLSNALIETESLKKLNLSSNNFGNEGCKFLSEAIEKNNTLTEIDLSNANLSYKGTKHVWKALEKNKTIIHVDLRFNRLNYQDYEDIGILILRNKTLKTLKLSRQERVIAYDHIDDILLQLEGHPDSSVEEIQFSSNLQIEKKLNDYLEINRKRPKSDFSLFKGNFDIKLIYKEDEKLLQNKNLI